MSRHHLTREFYDRMPYPPVRRARRTGWKLPPLAWMLALDDQRPLPRRVLVAGCGSGAEAFALRDALPDAEIVAVDFSARSIRMARQAQVKARGRRVRFLVADLSRPGLRRSVGAGFDLIVCHGVLAYVPKPAGVLRNLSDCLRPEGRLYLGVNGAAHFSARLRPVLRRLGVDVAVLPPGSEWRRVLQMYEEVDGGATVGPLGKLPDWYMGGDCFGPVIHNLPLEAWLGLLTGAGLRLRGSFGVHRRLRPMLASGATGQFLGCSRGEICGLVDWLHPTSFHWLLLTREPPADPPWRDRVRLLDWRPAPTGLYRVSAGRRPPRSGERAIVRLKSPVLDTQLAWPMPRWQSELLRRCDGAKSLGQLLQEIGRGAARADFREPLFLLYQFAVLNLLPPVTGPTRGAPRPVSHASDRRTPLCPVATRKSKTSNRS